MLDLSLLHFHLQTISCDFVMCTFIIYEILDYIELLEIVRLRVDNQQEKYHFDCLHFSSIRDATIRKKHDFLTPGKVNFHSE